MTSAATQTTVRMTHQLRELLDQGMVSAPGCYDPFSARLAELAGFEAVHLTGMGVELTQLGAPDLGLMTLTELAAHAARVTAAIGIPVLADVDTGFGGVLNIRRTIREMERAGVAGVHIEDQTLPKRCPALGGRQVVSRQQGIDRIQAACDARSDPDFVIVARTDADTISIDEVIERSNLYLQAGADMVMPMVLDVDGVSYASLSPEKQMALLRYLTTSIAGPVMGMGNAPPIGYTTADLAEAGFAFVMYASAALSASANAISEVFAAIRADATDLRYVAAHPGPYQEPLALLTSVHLDDYLAAERQQTAPY